MFAYMLTPKPCSEVTNMLYLSSGVLCVGSSGNQLEGVYLACGKSAVPKSFSGECARIAFIDVFKMKEIF